MHVCLHGCGWTAIPVSQLQQLYSLLVVAPDAATLPLAFVLLPVP